MSATISNTPATQPSLPPLSREPVRALYVHVPFCVRRCPYCDFYKEVGRDELIEPYLDALEREAQARRGAVAGALHTVFIGGGTPSFLDARNLDRLLGVLHAAFDLSEVAEWTVECNPNSLTDARAQAMRAAGVTRLSIGAQSFVPEGLTFLGRAHDVDDIAAAVRVAERAGFDSFNLDLITGLPHHAFTGAPVSDGRGTHGAHDRDPGVALELGDYDEQAAATEAHEAPDFAGLDRDVDAALALGPAHLSVYALTIEPETAFGRRAEAGERLTCGPDVQADLFAHVRRRLAAEGLDAYEVSNHARPGQECQHNLAIWRLQPYLGLGPGAHSDVAGRREANVRDVAAYIAAWRDSDTGRVSRNTEAVAAAAPEDGEAMPCANPAIETSAVPGARDRTEEHLLMGLRTTEGVNLVRAAARSGYRGDVVAELRSTMVRLSELGLLEMDADAVVRTTARGVLMLDRIVLELAAALEEE